MNLWNLAGVFALLSIFSFGGGNATVPQMFADSVQRYHWITAGEFARFFALGKLAPGPTLTMGTLIGYAVAGLSGAAVATAALLVPAGAITYALGRLWHRLQGWPWRERFARCIGPVVLGLIWAGGVAVAQGGLDGPATIAIAAAATAVMLATRVNQALLMLAAGVIGAVVFR
jgi:chromate transporter